MKKKKVIYPVLIFITVIIGFILLYKKAFAHCDTISGPVVAAAKKTLETGNINYALIWVQEKDEAEVKEAFQKTRAVRKFGSDAKELADKNFFETLVRLHRAGEGAPYTGLKPAGLDLGPAIPAADKAIITGNTRELEKILVKKMNEALNKYFSEVMEKKSFSVDDVQAGRAYVKAYVEYIHFAEEVYQSSVSPLQGHFDEPAFAPENK